MDVIKKFEPLFGSWYADALIGTGSFGRVYRIYSDEGGRRSYSALKYISIPADATEIKQFRADGMDENSISTYYGTLARDISSETAMMSRLRGSRNIVAFDESKIVPKPDGIGYDIFIRMELLDSLTNRMVENPLSIGDVAKLGADISNALILCAKQGIIHRDIKPDNIFASTSGDFKLGDFGIARQLEKTATFMSKKGTYNYMAPEVYKGEPYGASCDIYSLGLVMYRLLNNGRLPFFPPAPQVITPSDRETAVIRRMKGEPLTPPCQSDPELTRIVLKACAYYPRDRFASAQEMYNALQRYIAGSAARTHSAYSVPVGPSAAQRNAPAAPNRPVSSQNAAPAEPAPAKQPSGAIVYCGNCGAAQSAGSGFCDNCGTRLDAAQQPKAPAAPSPAKQQEPVNQPAPSKQPAPVKQEPVSAPAAPVQPSASAPAKQPAPAKQEPVSAPAAPAGAPVMRSKAKLRKVLRLILCGVAAITLLLMLIAPLVTVWFGSYSFAGMSLECFGPAEEPFIGFFGLISMLLVAAVIVFSPIFKIKKTLPAIFGIIGGALTPTTSLIILGLFGFFSEDAGTTFIVTLLFCIAMIVLSILLLCANDKRIPAANAAKPAPVQQRPAPAQQKPAPVQQKPAPAQQKSAPAQQKPAPAIPKQDAYLVGLSGMYRGARIDISDGNSVVLGRDSSACHIIFDISENTVSHKHCYIAYIPTTGFFAVTDTSSSGTYVNSMSNRLARGEETMQERGSVLYIGSEKNAFRLE